MTERSDSKPQPAEADLPIFAAWIEMWMAPMTIAARMMGMGPQAVHDDPEIDRKREDSQLPVPNPHQKAKDKDLFA